MVGKAGIDARAARKHALVIESDLNRALFTAELRELRQGALGMADFSTLTQRAKRWLPLVGSLAGWWTGTRRHRRSRVNENLRSRHDHDRRWEVLLAFLKLAGPVLLTWSRLPRHRGSGRPARD